MGARSSGLRYIFPSLTKPKTFPAGVLRKGIFSSFSRMIPLPIASIPASLMASMELNDWRKSISIAVRESISFLSVSLRNEFRDFSPNFFFKFSFALEIVSNLLHLRPGPNTKVSTTLLRFVLYSLLMTLKCYHR